MNFLDNSESIKTSFISRLGSDHLSVYRQNIGSENSPIETFIIDPSMIKHTQLHTSVHRAMYISICWLSSPLKMKLLWFRSGEWASLAINRPFVKNVMGVLVYFHHVHDDNVNNIQSYIYMDVCTPFSHK